MGQRSPRSLPTCRSRIVTRRENCPPYSGAVSLVMRFLLVVSRPLDGSPDTLDPPTPRALCAQMDDTRPSTRTVTDRLPARGTSLATAFDATGRRSGVLAMPDTWIRNAVAEAIGIFTLVFVGVLAVANEGDLTGAALAQGLAIAVMVAALGHVSGGHFNPAITLGLFLGRKIDLPMAIVYWVAQLFGGLVAALVVALATSTEVVEIGTPTLGEGIGAGWGIVLEIVATFFLVLVVFGTVVDRRAPASVYPFAIGLTITAAILAIGPYTGGALNPARAFGPALIGGEWGGVAAWLIGPLIGAVLAWAVHEYVLEPREEADSISESGRREEV